MNKTQVGHRGRRVGTTHRVWDPVVVPRHHDGGARSVDGAEGERGPGERERRGSVGEKKRDKERQSGGGKIIWGT